jgi:hypothetical protein
LEALQPVLGGYFNRLLLITFLADESTPESRWGEGELKFYLDNDIPAGMSVDEAVAEHGGSCYPTICGTGTEDYFLGSYNFEDKQNKRYQEYSTPYAGMPHVVRPDGLYESQTRFSLYRWHIPDPLSGTLGGHSSGTRMAKRNSLPAASG